jgi:hypothetical protein
MKAAAAAPNSPCSSSISAKPPNNIFLNQNITDSPAAETGFRFVANC